MVGKQTRHLFTVTWFYVDVKLYYRNEKKIKNEAFCSVYLPRQLIRLPSNTVSDVFLFNLSKFGVYRIFLSGVKPMFCEV